MNNASFWRQLGNSFVPTNYGIFSNVDKSDTAKFLTKFAIIVYMIVVAVYLFAILGYSVEITGGKFLSDADGYYYRVENGELKIDKPILVDDPANGVYVNITDRVEYFDGGIDLMLIYKDYEKILLISRTNRIKFSDGSVTGSNYFVPYTIGGGTENAAPFVNIGGAFIFNVVITGLIFCFFYSHIVEFAAVLYSFIAKLLCRVLKLGTDDEFLKKFCIYALVPAQIITLIAFAVFAVMYGTDFVKGSGHPVYLAIKTAAAVLPLIMSLLAVFADMKRRENYLIY